MSLNRMTGQWWSVTKAIITFLVGWSFWVSTPSWNFKRSWIRIIKPTSRTTTSSCFFCFFSNFYCYCCYDNICVFNCFYMTIFSKENLKLIFQQWLKGLSHQVGDSRTSALTSWPRTWPPRRGKPWRSTGAPTARWRGVEPVAGDVCAPSCAITAGTPSPKRWRNRRWLRRCCRKRSRCPRRNQVPMTHFFFILKN